MQYNNISLLVPFTSDNSTRETNWNWLRSRYELLMPEAEIIIGQSDSFPYSRAKAINNAARKATRDIFIITDADILFDVYDIEVSLNLLSRYNFILPLTKLVKFDATLTKNIISKPVDILISEIDITEENSVIFYDKNGPSEVGKYEVVGGICIISKDNFNLCGGYDERFKGWGCEDDAFFQVAKYLLKKYIRPINSTMYHLYHDSQPRINEYYNKNLSILRSQYFNTSKLSNTIEYLRSQYII